jgi:hypothetical protein
MMKTPMIACYTLAVLLLLPANSSLPAQERDRDASQEDSVIAETVESLYIKGLQIRDFDLIRTICIPDALLMGSDEEGQLRITTLDEWSVRFDPNAPPFQSLEYRIAEVDRTGTAAQVKIEFLVDGETPVTDYLHMLRLGDKWRVVNIIDY